MTKVVVACSRGWFARHPKSAAYEGLEVHEISARDQLTVANLDAIGPRYVFFPHWNWIVPAEIHQRFECVVFHTAPLPFGRGGSPIQNLILRGYRSAPVCALRMTDDLDAGPIYGAAEVGLDGTIDQIFQRIAGVVEGLILAICRDHPEPQPQQGEAVMFRRLVPADNEIGAQLSLAQMYDRIRMVDGDGYAPAYVRLGGYRLELRGARLDHGALSAQVRIVPDGD